MFIGYYSVANGVTLAGLVFSVLACMLSVLDTRIHGAATVSSWDAAADRAIRV